MSDYYNPQKTRGLYDPHSEAPHTLSRTKIELFMRCPRCFYMDQRLGTGQPPSMPFNLNSAVDELLKREFDAHRSAKTVHRYMQEHGIDALPYSHPSLDEWREALRGGVRVYHSPTNLTLRGAPDDLWVTPAGSLHVVDYKATSKETEVSLDAAWQIGYKRQVEFYQWLLRGNGFTVEPVAYFVYANGRRNEPAFNDQLVFDVKVIPYRGDDAWIEPTLLQVKQCLDAPNVPASGADCDYCDYRRAAARHERAA
jgi:PD-(D/E)XK nuclease superfamily protein